jgi:hypothetical protein
VGNILLLAAALSLARAGEIDPRFCAREQAAWLQESLAIELVPYDPCAKWDPRGPCDRAELDRRLAQGLAAALAADSSNPAAVRAAQTLARSSIVFVGSDLDLSMGSEHVRAVYDQARDRIELPEQVLQGVWQSLSGLDAIEARARALAHAQGAALVHELAHARLEADGFSLSPGSLEEEVIAYAEQALYLFATDRYPGNQDDDFLVRAASGGLAAFMGDLSRGGLLDGLTDLSTLRSERTVLRAEIDRRLGSLDRCLAEPGQPEAFVHFLRRHKAILQGRRPYFADPRFFARYERHLRGELERIGRELESARRR